VMRENARQEADDILAHCRARLAGYKCPRAVTFLEALPRNVNGKLHRRALP
jgi:acyl-CoA synthetase (AMP-forming)/AMP-acid ligase II